MGAAHGERGRGGNRVGASPLGLRNSVAISEQAMPTVILRPTPSTKGKGMPAPKADSKAPSKRPRDVITFDAAEDGLLKLPAYVRRKEWVALRGTIPRAVEQADPNVT